MNAAAPILRSGYGRFVERRSGTFEWKPGATAKHYGFLAPRNLGRDAERAKRGAAAIEAEVADRIARLGPFFLAGTPTKSPRHPADSAAVLTASVAPDGSWTVRRGCETLLAGVPRYRALELLRAEGAGGMVELDDV